MQVSSLVMVTLMEITPSRKCWAEAGEMKNAHSKMHAENRRIIEFPLDVMQKFRAED
jgi:hypothetical protein